MARYEVVRGAYIGTADDVIGRWYIIDREADIIDKRGRGWASRREAIETLVERLTGEPGGQLLVGMAEIAERAGVARTTVQSWRVRHADFPGPIVTLATGPVWDWHEVAAWIAIPRPVGRPRRS